MRTGRLFPLLLTVFCGILPRHVNGAVPAGFEDTVVAAVPSPTALAFTPDGRLLITTQPGQLRIFQNGALLPAPALDLAAILCGDSERGLLGVAVDPSFATNRFIYLFYTFRKSGTCERNTAASPVNRVSRFVLADTNSVALSSQTVLIDNIPSPNGTHNGGDLQIGRDGFLYVSVGDGGCDYMGDSGCAGANDAARDQHVLLGKILRITRTGGIPPTNPFQGSDSVRCGTTGRGQPGQKCQETFAWGLRNPFRIALDPNATGTRLFINDVGQNTWEEVDEGVAAADYGWPVREGHCANASTTNCGPPPAGMTNPIFDYAHANGCASITGGAFVPSGIWPLEFEGTYLFSDYVCGSIFRLTRGAGGTYTRSTFASGLGASSAVTMIFGPHGGTQALYYTTYAGGGQVRRIAAATNRAPSAVAAATPRSGPVPLSVRFDGTGSRDPDGDTLTYEWRFDDGSAPATGAVVTHTYSTAGRFTATLSVRDGHGGTDTATVTIDAGNTPPAAVIDAPTSTATFAVGQTITLRGRASDAQDGALPDSSLRWTVILHHNTHTHPYLPATSGNNVTFQAPAPEDLDATTTSYLEIQLAATDSQGATSIARRNVQPRRVTVRFESMPSGLTLSVNGTTVTTPRTVTSWEKYVISVDAPTQKNASGQAWLFSSWSDAGAAAHSIVTPAGASTYTATFVAAAATAPGADTYVRSGTYAAQNFGTATTLVVRNSASAETTRQTHLRFTVPNRPIGRAVLRMRGALSSATNVTVGAYPVAAPSWSETTVTWNSRPSAGTSRLASTTVKSTAASWYEWDLTAYVRGEVAAGRTAIGLALVGTAVTPSYAAFSSREASSNRPEMFITEAAAPAPSAAEIVLHAVDASASGGAWRLVTDVSAAGGMRMSHPDADAAKLTAPLASPANFFDLTFTAAAGRPYRLWIRGKADRNDYDNDSVFVQFSGSVTSAGAATWRIGSTSATAVVIEDCSGCGVAGWGWQDNGYGTGVLGPLVYFTAGAQTIRIQTREDGLSIDQVVLSPATYLNASPGATKNDTTILPKR